MVSLKKVLLLFVVFLSTVNPFCLNASETTSEGKTSTQEEVDEHIAHHLKDDYYFTFFHNSKTGKNYGFPLPVILIDNGLKVFSLLNLTMVKRLLRKRGIITNSITGNYIKPMQMAPLLMTRSIIQR